MDLAALTYSYRVTGEGAQRATVREPASFGIETIAEDGSPTPGGEALFVSIRGSAVVHARLADHADGTYTVSWKPPQSGAYHVVISKFGLPLPCCPFTIIAQTPEPSALTSFARGEALTTAHSQKTHTFDVSFRDALNAVTHAVELDVFVEAVPQGSPRTHKMTKRGPKPLVVVPAPTSAPAPTAAQSSFVRRRRKTASEVTVSGVLLQAIPEVFDSDAVGAPAVAEITGISNCGGRQLASIDEEEPLDAGGIGEDDGPQKKTRVRRIRVKVGSRALVVRAGVALDSDAIGHLLPGSIVTVLEEIITPGNVRACVALDHMDKETANGIKSSRGGTFRTSASSTYRPQMTDRTRARHGNGTHRKGSTSSRTVDPATNRLTTRPSLSMQNIRNTARLTVSTSAVAGSERGAPSPVALGGLLSAGHGSSSSAPATAPAPAPTVIGPDKSAAHSKNQERFGMKLATDIVSTDEVEEPTPISEGIVDADNGPKLMVSSGWVTLKKDGVKLVSSRLRLDSTTRQQYQRQWARRRSAQDSNPTVVELTPEEKIIDSSAFAFGGIYPGNLHARGKLHAKHHASYSIGVAGTYLLHVRLRKQAVSLPGSPFLLTVHPGPAFATNTILPSEISGEVGGLCSIMIQTGDQMGNACITGGASILSFCDPKAATNGRRGAVTTIVRDREVEDRRKRNATSDEDINAVQCVVDDVGDGSYKLTWDSKRTGTFTASVKIDGIHVSHSPTTLHLTSTKPDVSQSIVSGDGIRQVVKAELGVIRIRFFDTWGNATIQPSEFRHTVDEEMRMRMASPGQKIDNSASSTEGSHAFDGKWCNDGANLSYGEYQMTYTPMSSGTFNLHIFLERGSSGERIPFPGSPFSLNVHANASDQVVDVAVVDASGITPHDYKIARTVFEDVQKRWGDCTVGLPKISH